MQHIEVYEAAAAKEGELVLIHSPKPKTHEQPLVLSRLWHRILLL